MSESPVSAAFTGATALLSLVITNQNSRSHVLLKALLRPLFFSSHTELLCGLVLLNKFRIFEPQWGGRKYLNFILITNGFSAIVSYGMLAACQRSMLSLPSGPYGVIVASLVQFYMDIPVVVQSEHTSIISLACLLAFKLSLSSRLNMAITAISGLIAGLVYRHPKIRSMTLPGTAFAAGIIKKSLQPLLKTNPGQQNVSTPSLPYVNPHTVSSVAPHVLARQLLEGGFLPMNSQRLQIDRPPQDGRALAAALETLAGMGFGDARRNEALLAAHGGDVGRVVELLLR
jgi:hypothetical protein